MNLLNIMWHLFTVIILSIKTLYRNVIFYQECNPNKGACISHTEKSLVTLSLIVIEREMFRCIFLENLCWLLSIIKSVSFDTQEKCNVNAPLSPYELYYAISRSRNMSQSSLIERLDVSHFDDGGSRYRSRTPGLVSYTYNCNYTAARVVTLVNYPVDRARFTNVPGFLCVQHYNRHHSGGNIAPVVSFIFFLSSTPPPPSSRLRGNSVWFTWNRHRPRSAGN